MGACNSKIEPEIKINITPFTHKIVKLPVIPIPKLK